jgi:hypothetical protein
MNDIDIETIPPDTIDDGEKTRKKGVCGNRKGKNYEREVAKDLEKRFSAPFRRVPTSGAMMGGMNFYKNKDLRQDAKEILSGDLICPSFFPFSTELKNYYDTPKIHNLMSIGDATLDKWIEQAKLESKNAQKDWLIIFKVTVYRGSQFCVIDKKRFIEVSGGIGGESFIVYKDSLVYDYEYFWNKVYPYFSKTTLQPLINTNSTTGV